MGSEPVRDGSRSADGDAARGGLARQGPGSPGGAGGAASGLVRIGGHDRGPGLIFAAVAIFLAVALLKPWPAETGRAPDAAPQPRPVPTERPSVDPLDAVRLDCQEPLGWRTYSRERWSEGTLRSWRSIEPVRLVATPLDPEIPAVPVGPNVEALGYCAPWRGPERPPDEVNVLAWRIDEDGAGVSRATLLSLRRLGPTLRPPLGALYAPPVVGRGGGGDVWPPGTYVFAVEGGDYVRWWRVLVGEARSVTNASQAPPRAGAVSPVP